MSSPHHHHHPHPHPHHHYYSSCCSSSSSSYCSSAASCCCCCCCNSSSTPPSLPPPPSNTTTAAATDPLLHALANHLVLLLQSPKPSPPPPPLYSYAHLKPYPSPQTHQPPPHDHHHQQQQLLHSLLRRISALESSLPHLSPPPHPPPLHAHSKRSPSPKKHLFSPPPPPPPKTLQDLAARTIQTHFRLFLVRRSQTLRHLKRLASIKSHAAALRSSLSDKTHLHPAALSESAMALLLELDAIQGGDPMIREGKRSISRELTRILDFVDKVLVKEKEELMEIAENAYEVIPPTRTGKKVSFFEKEKGKRSPVSSASHEPFSENIHLSRRSRRDSGENPIDGSHHQLNSDDEDDDDDDDDDDDEEEEEEEEEEENNSKSNSESSKAKLGLSAPLPLQMEPRRLTASR